MSKGYNTSTNQNQDASLSEILASQLQDHPQSMDGRQQEYQQSGLNSPYAPHSRQQASEASSADQSSTVQYTPGQDYKPANFSSSATPNSEYGLPQSARSGSFPDYIQRSYPDGQQNRYSASATGGPHAGMAQTSNPSIAQSSPTYPPAAHNYSPYPPQQNEMPQYAGQQIQYGRPEWAGHYQQPMYGHPPSTAGGAPPNMVAHNVARPPAVGDAHYPPPPGMAYSNVVAQGGHPLSTVYSFVPIPGAQQHKRPRRRYEEIERMYKCGWNGCEKAYGTLNHLNAHVTMQSHGSKRTPEEFKEIRKEWKAKKKEEEQARKAEEDRQRAEAQQRNGPDGGQQGTPGQYGQPGMMPHGMGGPQLPPIGYQSATGQAPGQYGQPQQVDGAPQYQAGGQMYGTQAYPASPYAQGGMQYQQHPPSSQQPYQQQ